MPSKALRKVSCGTGGLSRAGNPFCHNTTTLPNAELAETHNAKAIIIFTMLRIFRILGMLDSLGT